MTDTNFKVYSLLLLPSTLASSGVMVAHLMPTLYLAMALAQSTVTGKKKKQELLCVPPVNNGTGSGCRGGQML